MQAELNDYYLSQLGIERWMVQSRVVLPHTICSKKELVTLAVTVAACTKCSLHRTRTQTVFARGDSNAELMVIGEAPGFYEDQQGLPFVGKAGGLLNQMLASIGLSENKVYISNVLKCRPPNNRDPELDEIEACQIYLSQQIQLIRPRLILALGRFAGQVLLQRVQPLGQMRNQLHSYLNIPVIVSYHPAYLLRNPKDKKLAYQDLGFVMKQLEQ